MERMLCSVREGDIHFALLAGNHSIFNLMGREGPRVHGTQPSTHYSRSSCRQVGPGKRIILNFATSLSTKPNNAFSCTGHGHLPWPLILSGRGILHRKKDFKEVGEVRNSLTWESQHSVFRGLEKGMSTSAFPARLLLLDFERVALLHAQWRQLTG